MGHQMNFFDNDVLDCPATEGIKYAGSKLKMIPHILKLARKVSATTVFDGFSGATRVSQAFAQSGYRVISNDIAVWSEIFATCYLLQHKPLHEYYGLIDHLNGIRPIDGWFTEYYGGLPNDGASVQQDGLKKPWQIHNTRKLDAIRQEIERLNLDVHDKAVAITSLILALDQVDNTIGHYASYLQNWSTRLYNTLVLKIPKMFPNEHHNLIYREDIFNVVDDIVADIAYIDPPYGSNNEKMPPSRVRYAAYYHIWKSICLFDCPELFGKAKRRKDSSDIESYSIFEDFRKTSDRHDVSVVAIGSLLSRIQARWIILSYSCGGRIAKHIQDVIAENGHIVDVVAVEYKRNVMSNMTTTKEWVKNSVSPNVELLFLIKKK